MFYKLSDKQINEILKKGIFDEKEYLDNLIVVSYTTGDVIDGIEDEIEEVLEHISQEEFYKRLVNNIDISDNTDYSIWEDIEKCYYDIRNKIVGKE